MSTSAFESEILTSELPEAVFLEDLDGNILAVNEQACDLLGYEREELLGLTVDDLVPEGAPAFLPDRIDEATKSGKPLETINVGKKGEQIPVELRGKLIEVEGDERMLISVRDISERKEAKSRPEYRSIISLPVGDIGVFQVLSEQVEGFSEEDVRLAELLCGHVYEATQRVRLENELKKEAIHDPLTGLYNRRYLNERLSDEKERAERYDKPIAFLMMDINRFKEVNDRYNHQTGDEVLQEVANLLKENVRNADTILRYGGDEFLVMMPETTGEVEEVLERIKTALENWNERNSLMDFPLSLAMGVSHWVPDQGRDVEEALKKADEKMYENKSR